MNRIILLLVLLAALPASAMTIYKDGSIMLTPEEIKNIERNFNDMQETIQQAAEIIEAQQKENEAMKATGKCI